MSLVTAASDLPYISRNAGEALTAGVMGAVKVADGEIYKVTDVAGLIMCGVIQNGAVENAKATLLFPCAWVANSGTNAIAYGNIGTLAYCVTDQIVAVTAGSTYNLVAGRILDVDATKGVLVDFAQKTADAASA